MNPKIIIIGAGRIGAEVYKQSIAKRWDVLFVLNNDGMYKDITKRERIGNLEDYKTKLDKATLGFLTIDNSDKGETAFEYIKNLLDKKIPVVTSEKGSLSNFYSELENPINNGLIGYSATVGGGSRLLRYLKERNGSNIEEIHAVINGTLNYIFDGLSKGKSLEEMVEEVKKLGYAEHGAIAPVDIINKEAIEDVPMKTAILFNICSLTEEKIKARDIKVCEISSSEIKKLIEESTKRRYVVSITRHDDYEKGVVWGFKHKIGKWYLSAGFKRIDRNPLFKRLVPDSVNNALLISEGRNKKYIVSGPGAGPEPTVNSMMIDAENIISTV